MTRGQDITNQRFGRLTTIKPLTPYKGHMLWLCKCDCGNETQVQRYRLLQGLVMSCGCMWKDNARKAGRSRIIDLTGQQFGELTVIKESNKEGKNLLWECQCSCGNTSFVRGMDLRHSRIKSCGCKRSEIQSEQGKKHADNILSEMVEGTNLAILNTKLGKANKSGIKGVHWNKAVQKWEAILTFQGQRHKLGQYENIQDAAKARSLAEEKYFDPILKKYGKETTES